MELHKNLSPENLHEAKHIASATSADIGKVLTPTAAAGVGELRFLKASELNWGVTLTTGDNHKLFFPSASTAGAFELRQVTFPDISFTGFCTTGDASKALMPSETASGVMELRRVKSADIDRSKDVTFNIIGTEKTTYAATAAVDPTFATLTDFVAYPFAVTQVALQGATWDGTTKTLTIDATSPTQKVLLVTSGAISSSANTTTLAIGIVVNGVLTPQRFTLYGKTAGDWAIGARFRELTLNPGDTLQIRLASSTSATLTQQDFSMALVRVMTE